MRNCIAECFSEFGADIGWLAMVGIVGCILLLIAGSGVTFPLFVKCVGIVLGGEVLVAIFACIVQCLRD